MGRIFACSDLHGRKDLYDAIYEFLKSDDIVYFLGDANDRGSQGWELIKAIYDNPQFIYLKGNHEDILWHALIEYFDDMYDGHYWYNICMNNGGYQTFYDAIEDPKIKEWLKKIAVLPTADMYLNNKGQTIHLSHSGCYWGNKKENLWDRTHFNYPRPFGDDSISVHGHTPTELMKDDLYINDYDLKTYTKNKVMFYCQDDNQEYHKIDIDVGACWNNFTCLLDLNTFEVIKLYSLDGIEIVNH